MKKYLLPAVAALLLAAIVYACSGGGDTLKLSHTNFDGEIDQTQNLVFTFNKEVAPENLIGTWDTTGYVEILPATAGRFKWTAKDELVFSPAGPFAPSTDFTAKLTKSLLRFVEKGEGPSNVSGDPVTFHTPYLDIESAESYWDKGRGGELLAKVKLNFNHSVKPQQLKELLKVSLAGTDVPVEISTAQNSTTIDLIVKPGKVKTDAQLSLVFKVATGLVCVESGWATKDPISYTATFPAADLLAISNVETEHSGTQGTVYVYTTQALPADGVGRYVTVTPSTNYTLQVTDNGFKLLGSFDHETTYTLGIDADLTGVLGNKLDKKFEQTFTFADLGEVIAFTSPKGQYLPGAGSRNLGVRVSGVETVRLRVMKVYENNLQAFFRDGTRYDGNYDEENDEYRSWQYYDVENYGDVIIEREYDVASLSKVAGGRLLDLNFLDKRKDFSGIYVVEVTSKDNYWVRDSKVLSISDIGLIARKSANDILVFANSLATTNALSGIEVSLISTNNQNVYKQTTGADGVAVFKDLGINAPEFRIGLITAKKGDDFNFLSLGYSSRVETSRFDIAGKMVNGRDYDAYLYGDRDLYRPNDSVHINAIVRTFDWQTVREMPVKLKVTLPTGREMLTYQGTLDAQGGYQAAFHLPPASPTGTYSLELLAGDNKLIGSRSISVEEFVPDRIKVETVLSKEKITPGEALDVTATATNLFGPPASFRNYELDMSLRRIAFAPKGLDAYDFSLVDQTNFENLLRSGQTDEKGQARQNFNTFSDYANIGLLEGRVLTTVFDETGRPVNRLNSFQVFTQKVFFGIGRFDYYVNTQAPLAIPLVATDVDGKPLNKQQAKLTVIKVDYETVLEKNYSSYRYVSKRHERVLVDKLVTLSGTTYAFEFMPNISGEYAVRLSKPGATAYVENTFYAYGWGGGNNESVSYEVSQDGNVIIETNKKEYTKGETAQVLFKAPFEGKLLVTYERDKVLEHKYIQTKDRAARLDISLKESHVPNLIISATLIRPMDGSSPVPLTVAHGFTTIKVDDTDDKLPVAITAAAKSTSRRKQTVTVKTSPGASVTIAAVDEGIMQIKNTASPDPYAYFYAARGLEVDPYDLYAELLPELKKGGFKQGSTGGDGMDLSRRVNPLTDKRVKLVSFWSGVKIADGSGNVSFVVDLPQFSGSIRIMAVAYKDARFGAAEQNMVVADPIVVSTALPRFLSPNDKLIVPVTLTNTTDKGADATATIKVTGPLKIAGSASQRVQVGGKKEGRVQFELEAQQAIGSATVEVTVQALGGTYVEKIEIPVRPASSLVKMNGSGMVEGGKTGSVNLAAGDFLAASRQGRIVVSRSPVVQFAKNLDYLLGYPYGCIEQTVSKAFPQLYYKDLVAAIGQKNFQSADYNVREAIAKVQSMQLYGGGVAYWPGGSQATWWGTIYAAHFLYEAKKAGYEVNQDVLEGMLRYLTEQQSRRETQSYYLYQIDGYKTYAAREITYSLFVLALNGRQQLSTMNYYKSNTQLLTSDAKYLLAATYGLVGDQASFRALLPQGFGTEDFAPQTGGSYGSPIRDRAIALYTLLEADPKNAQVGILARDLSERMKGQRWLNTQESTFGFLALGRFTKQGANSTVKATLKAGGKEIGTFSGKDITLTQNVAGQRLEITTTGTGPLYYFWETSGISASGQVVEEDQHLRVRRSYYTRKGFQVTGGEFEQNDLVVVRLTVSATENETIENVVITDLLPAGFEIENTRLTELPDLTWIKDQSTPEYMDVRDDRINFFTGVSGTGDRNYYYVVRAVSPGTYTVGPASADAMYNGEYHSYFGAGSIKVRPKGTSPQ